MADNVNFFDDKPAGDADAKGAEETVEDEVEKIKVGDDEFTQDELAKVVGLGKIGQEAEGKFKTDLTKVWPEYTKKSQELKEVKGKLEELEKAQEATASKATQAKADAGEKLTPEEVTSRALDEAKRLGLVTKDDFNQYYQQQRAGEKLVEDSASLVSQNEKDGKPTATTEEILLHMQETGIRKVEAAYKDLKETELDAWKEKQLGSIKRKGLTTEESSTAGSSKTPPIKVAKTEAELKKALTAHFSE